VVPGLVLLLSEECYKRSGERRRNKKKKGMRNDRERNKMRRKGIELKLRKKKKEGGQPKKRVRSGGKKGAKEDVRQLGIRRLRLKTCLRGPPRGGRINL